MIRCASASASVAEGTLCSTTANSSPPSRPQVMLRSIIAFSRAATCASSLSPTGWPSVSLTALNRSRSMISSAQRDLASLACVSARAEFFVELQSVGQAGQRVEPRHPGDLFSRRPLFGDVRPDAAKAQELARARRGAARRRAPTSAACRRSSTGSDQVAKSCRAASSVRPCRAGFRKTARFPGIARQGLEQGTPSSPSVDRTEGIGERGETWTRRRLLSVCHNQSASKFPRTRAAAG